jgi:hypothetical protein
VAISLHFSVRLLLWPTHTVPRNRVGLDAECLLTLLVTLLEELFGEPFALSATQFRHRLYTERKDQAALLRTNLYQVQLFWRAWIKPASVTEPAD